MCAREYVREREGSPFFFSFFPCIYLALFLDFFLSLFLAFFFGGSSTAAGACLFVFLFSFSAFTTFFGSGLVSSLPSVLVL
jgi:hypothetical protein